jgi:hypothetical protein
VPHLRLAEEDRKRLGGPELLPFDLSDVTNREAIEIARFGYKTPNLFRKALYNRNSDEDGLDWKAWTAAVWLALRRAGVEVDLLTFEFNCDRLEYLGDEDPEPAQESESGKAPAPSTTSARTRSTRGATSRATSSKRSRSS